MKKKIGHHTISGVIELKSGCRIGGSDDMLNIGAADLTCIKHPVTLKPYLPGSSLKGRLRAEQEKRLGCFKQNGSRSEKNNESSHREPSEHEPCGCGLKECLVCTVFGPHKNVNHELGPTRIIVRDAMLIDGGDLELKSENIINRKTGTAAHPRKSERVVSGSQFGLKIGLQIFDGDSRERLFDFVKKALVYVQETGIGSGISKGYGEIEFKDLKLDGEPFNL
jgi:CRISPR-associated protein Csm3